MASPSRQRRLAALEAEYRQDLVRALRDCAAGRWGLFGANDRVLQRAGLDGRRPAAADALLQLGAKIELLRAKLGYADPFALHAELLRRRRTAGLPDAPGEPTLALAWLRDLSHGDA